MQHLFMSVLQRLAQINMLLIVYLGAKNVFNLLKQKYVCRGYNNHSRDVAVRAKILQWDDWTIGKFSEFLHSHSWLCQCYFSPRGRFFCFICNKRMSLNLLFMFLLRVTFTSISFQVSIDNILGFQRYCRFCILDTLGAGKRRFCHVVGCRMGWTSLPVLLKVSKYHTIHS